jgi:pilus assembly protein CpaE
MTTRGTHRTLFQDAEPSGLTPSSGPDFFKALLIASDIEVGRRFRQALGAETPIQVISEATEFPGPERLSAWMEQHQPELVLVDVSGPSRCRGDEWIRSIKALRPQVMVVALDREMCGRAVVDLLRAGAVDYLSFPFAAETMAEFGERFRRMLRPEEPMRRERRGRVLAFGGAKPGCGTTTIALQTAFALRRLGARTLFIDLNVTSGTSLCWVEGEQRWTSAPEIMLDPGRMQQPSAWKDWAASVHGIELIPAPVFPLTTPLGRDELNLMLEAARRFFDYVVVDLPSAWHELTLEGFPLADECCLVTTPDLPSLHLTQRVLGLMEQSGILRQDVRLILNRTSPKDPMTPAFLTQDLRMKLEMALPNEFAALMKLERPGRPLIGTGALSKGIKKLAESIAARGEVPLHAAVA